MFKSLLTDLLNLLDPDREWWSPDKRQHMILSAGVCLAFGLPMLLLHGALWPAAFGALAFGVGWEGGQADTAHGLAEAHVDEDLDRPVKAGYGFGLLDICWNAGGVAMAYVLLVVLRALFQ